MRLVLERPFDDEDYFALAITKRRARSLVKSFFGPDIGHKGFPMIQLTEKPPSEPRGFVDVKDGV
jgi:hypothetical protein